MAEYPPDLPAFTKEQQAAFLELRKAVTATFPSAGEQSTGNQDGGATNYVEAYPGVASDQTLTRFLRARKFDVKGALEQYSAWREWLKKENVALMHTQEPKCSAKLRRLYVVTTGPGYDREGHPLFIERMGAAHMPSLRALTNVDEYVQHHIWICEQAMLRCNEQSERLGRPVCKVTWICDMAGLGMQHRHGLDFFGGASAVDERYYPETLCRVLIVNAPWVFPTIYGLAKPMIDPETRTKILILGQDWKKQIQKYIAPDQLPQEYGGTAAYNVPEPAHHEVLTEVQDLDLTKLVVSARARHQVEVKASRAGVFGWFVRCEAHNIELECIFVSEAGGGALPMLEQMRVSVHDGSCTVQGPGTAYFTFSNEFSRMRSKTVEFSLSFAALEEEEAVDVGGTPVDKTGG